MDYFWPVLLLFHISLCETGGFVFSGVVVVGMGLSVAGCFWSSHESKNIRKLVRGCLWTPSTLLSQLTTPGDGRIPQRGACSPSHSLRVPPNPPKSKSESLFPIRQWSGHQLTWESTNPNSQVRVALLYTQVKVKVTLPQSMWKSDWWKKYCSVV